MGASLRVAVTATNAVGSGTATSWGVGPVASGAPQNTVRPSISGSGRYGQTLRVTTGSWSPAASTFAFEWQRSTDGGSTWANISGAGASSYTVSSKDAGTRLRARVTGANFSLIPGSGSSPLRYAFVVRVPQ